MMWVHAEEPLAHSHCTVKFFLDVHVHFVVLNPLG
jgi:hypothetical protein